MDPDLIFLVPYSCPRCHASLEARAISPPAWLRCPACGRAGLPPEQARDRSSTSSPEDEPRLIGQFTTVGGPSASLPLRPRAMAPLPSPVASRTPTGRLLLGSGFFLSTALFLFSLLDSSGARAGFFGFVALACLILLTRRGGRRDPD